MSPLEIQRTLNMHHIQSASGGGLKADLKLDFIIIHDSREVMPTMRSLACSFSWLVPRIISLFQLCSCNNIGEERGLFSVG